ncbi:signal peptidase II [Patescibacteria group bacterium]
MKLLGMTQQFNCNPPSLPFVVALVVFFTFYVLYTQERIVSKVGAVLVLLGGVGNFYQFFSTGCVLDNIAFLEILYFNVFDVVISCGLIAVAIGLINEKNIAN